MPHTDAPEIVVRYSIPWPFHGGRQWFTVEQDAEFGGWSIVSHYEERKGFAVQSSHASRRAALVALNGHHLRNAQRFHAHGLVIEETELVSARTAESIGA